MTKAKNSPPRVESKKTEKTDGKKAEAKSVAKTKKGSLKTETPPAKKPAKSAPAEKKTPAKATTGDNKAKPSSKTPVKDKKPSSPPPAPAPEPVEENKPAAGESANAGAGVATASGSTPASGSGVGSGIGIGIGVKTASKKPGISVPPGVMFLGRPTQSKPETAQRPSERRLSKKEQGEIKSLLLEKRERLLAGMRRELAMQKERAESKAADEVDKATDAYDEDLSFEIATANDQELRDIQIALEKIENGTYGECEVCGCAISPSRLKILPSATTCVACRGQEEQARRRDDGIPAFGMFAGEEGEPDAEPL